MCGGVQKKSYRTRTFLFLFLNVLWLGGFGATRNRIKGAAVAGPGGGAQA